MKPVIGSIVVVRLVDEGPPVYRPAIVTRVWSNDTINVQVFFDGANDDRLRPDFGNGWLASISKGHELKQWSWPVGQEVAK